MNTPHDDPREMSFIGHLSELRRALVISAVAVLVGAMVGFYYHSWFLQTLMGQIPDVRFVIVSPAEGLSAVLRLSILLGLFLALPVILREFFWFIGPAFTPRQRLLLIPVTLASYVLFVLGVLFSYGTLLPLGVRFLIGFTPPGIQPMLSIGRYIDFSTTLLFGTGLLFQVPVLMLVLALLGVVRQIQLKTRRKYVYFGSFVVAAVITPSVDILTQSLLGGTLIFLFELGLILMGFAERLHGKTGSKEEAFEEEDVK
ncbi:twin-arginine translocase subunit TatC [bacterium (Candidatus Blackallbacteria) CG17_big_fil_post_rev_8_21_14_2_50_48_46]|uniref:Sec-independent protein translocase protein TatC n=1 Tax=bacterium (Candidatus Blackallbacteria) CG17_big_fil_post_rev_8_21_14_2_50_48_46 TaxID=2014261 RepID=A0A2M7FXG8_9BACT|nr:MAG: twin-arginine translocase subunit TatC [bacterium (Candidatus Blackallbacteria) CG18_big_fil_WC_8_21_14_2_50_49_26]PIW13809.1 MAG: twin-arginine translocase subunit TatC [bacterium (Candidatus Blackallbacteria) CG17_big_fil_post_rev_8_21_14_2_50_48_46]PIW45035.1 MAG: twin-arginine translocase subunit TatC [bacterium (Candidatus Blackallbacteria) CG13_big_fil_rev_8_21_14_2_50_49_14]